MMGEDDECLRPMVRCENRGSSPATVRHKAHPAQPPEEGEPELPGPNTEKILKSNV
jgi:hypothetical protein